MKKIAVATSKGGVGKTTIVTNLAAGLAKQNKKVLMIDCDAQGNLQNQFNIKTEKTLVDLLMDGEVEVASVRPNLDLINSGKHRLAEAEIALSGRTFREKILSDRLKPVNGYDYVFCDLSPTIPLVNTMALFLCDSLLIPISMSFYSITGALQILSTASDIAEYSKIDLCGLVMNLYDERTNIAKMISSAVLEKWSEKVFKTVIRKNVSIEEAPSQRKTIFEHAPRSHGSEDFTKLVNEFLERID